jgi:predicted AlkP superfamily pyrophosphatase or phosphodiesterase/thioredoxin-like negative regulator of GroEL
MVSVSLRAPRAARLLPPVAALILLAFLLPASGCARETGAGAGGETAAAPPPPLLLVGWDGADLEIIERLRREGRLPVLDGLARRGALGVLRSEEPMISPILWTTLATGVSPERHGILGFFEPAPDGGRRYVTSGARRVPAFWNIATEAGLPVGVVSWYATWPAEPVLGFLVSDRIGLRQVEGKVGDGGSAPGQGLVHPASEAAFLDSLDARVPRPTPQELARRFFSLGPEQLAGRAEIEIEPRRLEGLADAVRSTRLITEAAAELARRHRPRLLAVYYEGIDAAGHLFMDAAPPALETVPEAQRELLAPVVDRFYELQDELLAPLLEAVGEGANVLIVSDHGFRHGADRPVLPPGAGEGHAPAWHRLEGVVLLSGPGIRPGSVPEAATLYDVLPTLCALTGLPRALSLEGRVLEEVLAPGADRSPPDSPADYGPRRPPPAQAAGAAPAEAALVERLRSLGYLVEGEEGAAPAGEGIPPDPLGAYNLGVIRLRRDDLEGARAAFAASRRLSPDSGLGDYGLGLVALKAGDPAEALEHLAEAERKRPSAAVAYEHARALLGLGRLGPALRAAERSLERDPADRPARLLAARLYLLAGETGRARRHLEALPSETLEGREASEWHFLRAIDLRAAGRPTEACEELEEALRAWPGHPEALDQRCGPAARQGGNP